MRMEELEKLGVQSRMESWKICYSAENSSATIILSNSAKSIEVRMDSEYPNDPTCMEIVSVGPNGTFADIETLQVCCYVTIGFLIFVGGRREKQQRLTICTMLYQLICRVCWTKRNLRR
jgi:hypothetical protein